jgi:hypothetical protein
MDALAHRVKFFGARNFGAYAAVAIKYASPLLLDSIKATADGTHRPDVVFGERGLAGPTLIRLFV